MRCSNNVQSVKQNPAIDHSDWGLQRGML